MKRLLLIFSLIALSNSCFADFVDIATIKVNGKLIRKLTRNNSSPYLICLSEFKPNDIMTISVWTDYGGEYNSYLTYKNKLTNEVDTINRKSKIILTEDMITNPYQFSVSFIHERNNKITENSWTIFESTNNARVEKAYSHLNQFIEELKTNFSNMDDFFLDSIECNISSPKLDKKGLRQTKDTIFISQNNILELLTLTDEEIEYLSEFNSKDYVQLYNIGTQMYGQIYIDNENLNWIS
ncbi:MAG: hypothetical protein R3321_11735, partial [Nitrososphaeraceae archaeon]|nr:hypothetical protein [Nitrososphaeraceae archaeon]